MDRSPDTEVSELERAAQGEGTSLTASQLDAVRSRLSVCWRGTADMPNPETLWATVRFELNRDGTLRGLPRVVGHSGGRYGEVVGQTGSRAVVACEPFSYLPADRYDGEGGWRVMTINFGATGVQ